MKIEAFAQDDRLTAVDLEILLACLPPDYGLAVRKELLRLAKKTIAEGNNSTPRIGEPVWSRGKALEEILGVLPAEIAERARFKIASYQGRKK